MSVRLLLPFLLLFVAVPVWADATRDSFGGDMFVAGSGTVSELEAERDLFVAGGSVVARGGVAQDAHFIGMDIDIETDVGGDVYAAGGSVTLRGAVGEDLTAAGFSVRTARESRVAGNARLAGGTVVIDGPIEGALLASGGEVVIDGAVGGDVRVYTGSLRFGPEARIEGTLAYTAPEEAAIPASVIDPTRVSFTRSERWETVAQTTRDWRGREYPAFPRASAIFGGLVVTIGFFVVLAAIALALWPERIEAMRRDALMRPGYAILGGVLGLATAFGLVPISAMTILGLPLLPVILLAIVVIWMLGYAFGVYILSLRVWSGLGGVDPATPVRLAVFAAGLLAAALLNVIPFAGWVVNFTLVLFGLGALAVPAYRRLFAPRIDPV
jgi:hypothetical protein